MSEPVKSRGLRSIEEKMSRIEPGSYRYKVLEQARNFKTSWIGLGQILYSVHKDRMYKEWGYQTFEAYCKAEAGIHQQTAAKLLHSYFFLEKNESGFLKEVQDPEAEVSPKKIPTHEAVNVLRLAANNKELAEDDYQDFKKKVFDEGVEGKDVRKAMGLRLRSIREEEDPEKVRDQRRRATLHRLLSTIKSLHKEVVHAKLVSERTTREMEVLEDLLAKELGE